MPNSEVKPLSADGSVGLPHVRVGHRQAPLLNTPGPQRLGVFALGEGEGKSKERKRGERIKGEEREEEQRS